MIQLVWPTIGFQIFIAFTLSIKMIQEQAAVSAIIALFSEKNKSRKKGKKEESVWNFGFKEEKT